MKAKILSYPLLISILSLFFLASCVDLNYDDNDETDLSTTTEEAESDNEEDHADASDYIWDTSEEQEIILNGSSMTVNDSSISVSELTISSAGVYNLSGSLTDGKIIVDTEDEDAVTLILNDVDIACSYSAPIDIENAEKVIINLYEGTENSLTDGSSYDSADGPNAALYSTADLTIFGEGSLSIDANYEDGIASKDGLIIASGSYTISAEDDGIRGKDYLIIKEGDFDITAGGDGLKSNNEDDSSCGYISIEAGTFDITSGDEAIEATTDILISYGTFSISSGGGSSYSSSSSAKGLKSESSIVIDLGTFSINSADDAIHCGGAITINDGDFTILSGDDGIHSDTNVNLNEGDITVNKSVEGIEGSNITVTSGTINVYATDDGFNATQGSETMYDDGSQLTVNGGTITVTVSGSDVDAMDSNGDITISAGTVYLNYPTSSRSSEALDANGTITIGDDATVYENGEIYTGSSNNQPGWH